MNKKGGTLTNWIFVMGFVLLFVFILQSQILDNMNNIYDKTYSTGLNTSGLNDLQSLKSSSDTTLEGAEVEQTSDGLTLKDTGTIGKTTYKTLAGFISGGFISTLLTDIMGFPEIVATILIVLIWISLVMIIIHLFMKVEP